MKVNFSFSAFYQSGLRYLAANWKLCLFLCCLIGLTLYMRSFALDYPSVGFHNEKENEWLAVTKDYYHNGFSTCKQILHHEGTRDRPCFENPQLAFISVVGALSWGLFGESIALIRIQMVLYMLLSVLLGYGIVRRICSDKLFAATVSVVWTLMPLTIFFGRTINEAAPGNFFMMLSFWLFLLWRDNHYRWKYSVSAGASLALAGMIKMPYVLPIIALFGVFPYADFYKNFKRRWFLLAGFLSFVVLFVGFLFVLQKTNLYFNWRGPIGTWGIVQPFRFLDPAYWSGHWRSHKDVFFTSYNNFFLFSALFGFLLCMVTRNKIKGFLLLYFVGIMLTYSIFGHFLKGQNYYSLSFTFGLAIAAGYLFYQPLKLLATKFPDIRPVVYFAVLIPFAGYAQINKSVTAQFNTQFPGGDLIGTLIGEDRRHPEERIFYYRPGPQTKSLCYYAFMTCAHLQRVAPEKLKEFEEKHHIRYLYVDSYVWEHLQNSKHWPYVRENYAVRQVGLRPRGNNLALSYILLKRGGPYSRPEITRDKLKRIEHYYFLRNIWTRKQIRLPFYVIDY